MRFDPTERIVGELRPPPDKSISHRAALFAAIGDGSCEIKNYLRSDDTAVTIAAIHELGAQVELHEPGASRTDLVVTGVGLRGPCEPDREIDVGNAGTLMRLLPGWLAGQDRGRWVLDGDDSIRRRPMDRIAEPLQLMGARIECRDGSYAPIRVEGAALDGIEYQLPVASAQVKSCVLLAGLLAQGTTTVVEPVQSRDHTERLLMAAGVGDGTPSVHGVDRIAIDAIDVPGDFSSAAFFIVAATVVPGSELVLDGVGLNPTRTGLLDVLDRMGARVARDATPSSGGEPAGRIAAAHAELRATVVEPREVGLLIDELPLVALLGAFADGTTVVKGAQELRHKESDRIATVVEGMTALGATIEATEDGFAVTGTGGLRGGTIASHGDHRLAMLGAIAGVASREGADVPDFEVAAVSYPGFARDLDEISG